MSENKQENINLHKGDVCYMLYRTGPQPVIFQKWGDDERLEGWEHAVCTIEFNGNCYTTLLPSKHLYKTHNEAQDQHLTNMTELKKILNSTPI